jgi:hypothetical protein
MAQSGQRGLLPTFGAVNQCQNLPTRTNYGDTMRNCRGVGVLDDQPIA